MKKYFLLVLYFMFAAVPLVSYAALLFLDAKSLETAVNTRAVVSVMLDTEGAQIGAVEGEVVLPPGLELVGISEAESVVGLWVEAPRITEGSKVRFSGIIPGGFQNIIRPLSSETFPGTLFGLILRASEEGEYALSVDSARVFSFGAEPESIVVRLRGFTLSVREGIPVSEPEEESGVEDTTPPEAFSPVIFRNAGVFDGMYVLVFATKDPQSGIFYYEVKEGNGDWKRAESPYILENQEPRAPIAVKAVDRSGNIRVGEVGNYPLSGRAPFFWWSIIGVLLASMAAVIFHYARTTKTKSS